jgi:hypothetical protein
MGTEKNQGAINRKDAGKFIIDHNFFAGTDGSAKTSGPQNDIGKNAINGGNPGFVSARNYNFHIARGSILLHTGIAISPGFPNADGFARSQGSGWTIGAYGLNGAP